MPVAHVVTITFIDDTPTETVDTFHRNLGAVSAVCSGIESFRHGRDINFRTGTADYAISAVFIDENALRAYLTHPEHVRITNEFEPNIAAKTSVQFQIDAT